MDHHCYTSCFMASWFYHCYRRLINTHIVVIALILIVVQLLQGKKIL